MGIRDVIPRMRPVRHPEAPNGLKFLGSARMATPVVDFKVITVGAPFVGETIPSSVECEIEFNLSEVKGPNIRHEWNTLKEHDVMFLIAISPPEEMFRENPLELSAIEFMQKYGIRQIRGVEITELLDEENNVISDPSYQKDPVGDRRVIKCNYDTAQYQADFKTEMFETEQFFIC